MSCILQRKNVTRLENINKLKLHLKKYYNYDCLMNMQIQILPWHGWFLQQSL